MKQFFCGAACLKLIQAATAADVRHIHLIYRLVGYHISVYCMRILGLFTVSYKECPA